MSDDNQCKHELWRYAKMFHDLAQYDGTTHVDVCCESCGKYECASKYEDGRVQLGTAIERMADAKLPFINVADDDTYRLFKAIADAAGDTTPVVVVPLSAKMFIDCVVKSHRRYRHHGKMECEWCNGNKLQEYESKGVKP